MAPYGIFSGEAVPYSADLALTSPYCDFIQPELCTEIGLPTEGHP